MTATATQIVPEHAIQPAAFAARGTPRGRWAPLHLEEVRDDVRRRLAVQNPRELDRSLQQAHFRFAGVGGTGTPNQPRATLQLMGPQGLEGEPMLLTRNGLEQLGREVLPAYGISTLKALAAKGEQGRKIADVTMAMFMRDAETPRMLRVADYTDPVTKDRRPTVRAVLSQGFATYDDWRLLDDLLMAVESRNLPVLSYHATDTGLRIRLATTDQAGPPELKTPIPMIEVWNSEVGRRSVGLQGGMWRLICTNGMGSWEKGASFKWTHSGDHNRISAGLRSAVTELQTRQSGVLDAYRSALDVAIDNAWEWMNATLSDHLSDHQVQRAQVALNDPTTTPGGTLASVVDAITLAAQDERDLYDAQTMEKAAGHALRAGLAQMSRTGRHTLVAEA